MNGSEMRERLRGRNTDLKYRSALSGRYARRRLGLVRFRGTPLHESPQRRLSFGRLR